MAQDLLPRVIWQGDISDEYPGCFPNKCRVVLTERGPTKYTIEYYTDKRDAMGMRIWAPLGPSESLDKLIKNFADNWLEHLIEKSIEQLKGD